MDFFEEWIFTRIRERGWPKSKGLLRKKVVSEGAIVESMQDAVRIALILGSGIPDVAKSIVIQNIANVDLATSPSQQDVYDWDDPSVGKMLGMANRNAHIAMAWAIENPDDCVQLFHSDRAEQQT